MEKSKNLMVDLETLGTSNNAVFLSIGAVSFCKTKSFYRNVTLESAIAVNLKIDASTLQWWLTQKPEVMRMMFDKAEDLLDVLIAFRYFYEENDFRRIWGNSASFDLCILANGYKALNQHAPWTHRDEYCFRTVKNLFPLKYKPAKIGNAHDPITDCIYQIDVLRAIENGYKIEL